MSATQGNDDGRTEPLSHGGRPRLRIVHRADDERIARNAKGATSPAAPQVIPVGRLAHRMLRQWQATSFVEDLNTAS